MMKVVGMIPVRLESSRLPEKALADIDGLPMIVHTFKRARLSRALNDLFVVTDSTKIKDLIEAHDGKVILTGAHHKTGSDRIAEAAKDIEAEIIVNIQGDEPLLDPEHIDEAVRPLIDNADIQVSVLVTPFGEKNSPSDIKAVLDRDDFILYCSRADLPSGARHPVDKMWKMSFIVPFRKSFLLQFASWPQSRLEKIEYIEHLRILEKGVKFKAVRVDHAEISVDTPKDLAYARQKMVTDPIKRQYRDTG